MQIALKLLVVCFAFALLGEARGDVEKDQSRIAAQLEALPFTTAEFTFYSLDPAGGLGYATNNEHVFHGFRILGKAEIKEAREKQTLFRAFSEGVRENQ